MDRRRFPVGLNAPLKLYVLYAPPEHDRGTVHPDKAAAEADEHH